MELRPKDIEIPKAEPFEHDLLNRKQYTDVLTQIVKHAEGGFTLSINADWGYGKTTFVKMWEKVLQNEGYQTIYFNAWETDFVADPMMALIDGLREGFDSKDLPQEKLQLSQAVWKAAAKLIQLIPQFKAIGEVAEIFQNGINACLEDQNKLQEHQSYHKLIQDFKEQLTKFSKEISPDKQLIIFVDELDRCRPDYAVQMLERIKHFFSIDNIIFVLSVDKKVLCKSIKAVYGGLEIDTEAYLRRFVDVEFDLPEPEVNYFVEALYKQKGLAEYFTGYWDYNSRTWGRQNNEETLRESLWNCLLTQSLSLRDVEKYFNRLEIILNSKELPHSICDLIAYLLYLQMFHHDIYDCLRLMKLDAPEMWNKLYQLVNEAKVDETSNFYRPFLSLAINCLAYYIFDKERYDQGRNPIYKSYHEGKELTWVPEEYRTWLQAEINSRDRYRLKNLFPHFELVNARFDIEKQNNI